MILPDRIESKINKSETCWLWISGINRSGYGFASWQGKRILTHRLMYELLVGPVPEGLQIDHLCRNRACCNPAHLEVVTLRENVRRRGGGQSRIDREKTHCPKSHPYDEKNTYKDKRGRRYCRSCHRERTAIRHYTLMETDEQYRENRRATWRKSRKKRYAERKQAKS